MCPFGRNADRRRSPVHNGDGRYRRGVRSLQRYSESLVPAATAVSQVDAVARAARAEGCNGDTIGGGVKVRTENTVGQADVWMRRERRLFRSFLAKTSALLRHR